MTVLYKIILFAMATIGIVWISRSSLRNIQSHGFYRFFAWEIILILFLMNVKYWFVNPFCFRQIISWSFLTVSSVLIYKGVQLFIKKGKLNQEREDSTILGIEKTTELVTTGVFLYIRHPFYSSLLFLTWGILLKNVSWIEILLAVITTIFLITSAKKEEVENIQYFGSSYKEYMKRTKMLIPYIF